MATDLIVHGPIEIPYVSNGSGTSKRITADDRRVFLEQLKARGLSKKHGCYVFALRAGKGFTPWYVGKATRAMDQECLGLHQLNYYNDVLFKDNKGTPVMFFVAPSGGKAKVPQRVCDEAETHLIQSAYFKNPDIRNVQKTKVPEWTIKGVVRASRGKPAPTAQKFRRMMGL